MWHLIKILENSLENSFLQKENKQKIPLGCHGSDKWLDERALGKCREMVYIFFPQKVVVFGGLDLMKYARLSTYTYDVMSNRLERGKIKQLFWLEQISKMMWFDPFYLLDIWFEER